MNSAGIFPFGGVNVINVLPKSLMQLGSRLADHENVRLGTKKNI